MAASAGCTNSAGVPVEAESRGDLASDMAGFTYAGDDHAALRGADQVDRGRETRAETVAQRGR